MTTRPINQAPLSSADIETVFGDGVPRTLNAPAETLLAEWRRVAAFVKWPTLPDVQRTRSPFTVLLRVFALDIALMAALVGAAFLAMALGYEIAPTALSDIDFTLFIVLTVIVGAPVFEELIFRSWLSGRPGQLLALLCLLVGGGVFAVVGHAGAVMPLVILGPAALGAVLALVLLRGRPPMRWFAVTFPLWFWVSTLAFALVHLANFEEASLLTLLPLVLPQFLLGGLLAYLRVRVGLWAAILLHAMHNATALGLASLAMQAA